MLRSRKAQAILELAILGALVITAFAVVISTSENYNRNQSYMQQTFRATLYKAQEANDTGSVSTVDFRRLPNVTNPMELGALQQYSSGNSVLWSDGKKKNGAFTEAKQYFLHNRSGYELVDTGASGTMPNSVVVTSSGYTNNPGLGLVTSDSTLIKDEDTGDYKAHTTIHTTKDLVGRDTVGGWATVGDKTVGTGGELSPGGVYTSGGGVVRHTNDVQE